MKAVVLGAGGMGRYAAQTAVAQDFIEELVVGDLDGGAADALAGRLGNRARGAAVDVLNEKSLLDLFAGADAVLNTVGPFFRLGPPVLRAAVRAGVHYLDINDDWESTEAMLALDEDARAAGITAVIGVGASPGMSNMLACLAMRELDEVDEVIAGFDLDAAMPEERALQEATQEGAQRRRQAVRGMEGSRSSIWTTSAPVDPRLPGPCAQRRVERRSVELSHEEMARPLCGRRRPLRGSRAGGESP